MPKCVVHLHDHQNKEVPFMKPSIFADFSNGAKFHYYTYWSTNDTHNYYLSCQDSDDHIGNKYMVLMNHVEIDS